MACILHDPSVLFLEVLDARNLEGPLNEGSHAFAFSSVSVQRMQTAQLAQVSCEASWKLYVCRTSGLSDRGKRVLRCFYIWPSMSEEYL